MKITLMTLTAALLITAIAATVPAEAGAAAPQKRAAKTAKKKKAKRCAKRTSRRAKARRCVKPRVTPRIKAAAPAAPVAANAGAAAGDVARLGALDQLRGGTGGGPAAPPQRPIKPSVFDEEPAPPADDPPPPDPGPTLTGAAAIPEATSRLDGRLYFLPLDYGRPYDQRLYLCEGGTFTYETTGAAGFTDRSGGTWRVTEAEVSGPWTAAGPETGWARIEGTTGSGVTTLRIDWDERHGTTLDGHSVRDTVGGR